MKKRIWIINQYASHLETRHLELSRAFAAEGVAVTVIATSFHHGKREYLYDTPIRIVRKQKNVTYVYLHSGPAYTENGAKRFLNMLDFCRMLEMYHKTLASRVGKPDIIIASSAPPFVWESGYRLSRKYQAKFVAEFRDIWPQSLVDLQGISPSNPLVKVLERVEKRAYQRADAIVSTMPFAWKHVMEVADVPRDKIHWMANGINMAYTDACLNSSEPLPEDLDHYLGTHWCCVYIGSIVKSECLEFLLDAFSRVEDEEIWFAVIGDGHEKERIRKLAESKQLARLRFFPAIHKDLIPKALAKSGVCVAAHEDNPTYRYGLSMNKLNDYLASGKPTVFAFDSENIVKDAGHYIVTGADAQEMADVITQIRYLDEESLKILHDRARDLMCSEYDYPQIGKRYLDMLRGL